MAEFSELLGQTIVSINGLEYGSGVVTIETRENKYYMYHEQDCCESVYVEDVEGFGHDLLNAPLLMAEEVSKHDEECSDGTGLWTFYKLGTIHGTVTIRWYGSSNGYYGVSVSVYRQDQMNDWELKSMGIQ